MKVFYTHKAVGQFEKLPMNFDVKNGAIYILKVKLRDKAYD